MNKPDVAGSAKEGPTTSWSGSTSPITVGLLGVQDWSAGDVGFDGARMKWWCPQQDSSASMWRCSIIKCHNISLKVGWKWKWPKDVGIDEMDSLITGSFGLISCNITVLIRMIRVVSHHPDHQWWPKLFWSIRIRQKMKNDDEDDANATKSLLRNAGVAFELIWFSNPWSMVHFPWSTVMF